MIQYHELFSPTNSSVTPRTFCTNFTYFYLLYPSVSLFWNAQDSHVIAYARIPCRLFATFSYQSKDHPTVYRAFDNRKWVV